MAALCYPAHDASAGEPARLGQPFVVTQLPASRPEDQQPAQAGGMLPAAFGVGARMVLVLPDSSRRVRPAGFTVPVTRQSPSMGNGC